MGKPTVRGVVMQLSSLDSERGHKEKKELTWRRSLIDPRGKFGSREEKRS